MVVPFLTLCTDICPLTTGNLLQVEQSLRAAHAADKVQIIELSVDPGRDSPARLAAYAHLTMADWELVTETPAVLHSVAQFFGFVYQKVPEDKPPSIDWLTGKPLTYDINHSDGYVLIGPTGIQRYSTGAAPKFRGKLNPKLHAFLDDQGLDHLAHPPPIGVDAGGRIVLSELAPGTNHPRPLGMTPERCATGRPLRVGDRWGNHDGHPSRAGPVSRGPDRQPPGVGPYGVPAVEEISPANSSRHLACWAGLGGLPYVES